MTLLIFMSIVASALEAPPKDAVPIPMAEYNFDHELPGKLPKGFTPALSGAGPSIHWEIRDDPQAPSRPYVLAQSGKAEPGENFALMLLDGRTLENGEVAVRFKVVAGEEDQAAGIVWRYRDPQTYYVVRANALEDNCCVYRVTKGKRKLLDEQAVVVSPYIWHDLRLVFVNRNFTVFLDNEMIVGGKDKALSGVGQVGLWTKADSSIRFDDFRISK
jgi:hypothetical protein